jgi:hypothetical protein
MESSSSEKHRTLTARQGGKPVFGAGLSTTTKKDERLSGYVRERGGRHYARRAEWRSRRGQSESSAIWSAMQGTSCSAVRAQDDYTPR